ncbi:MAG: hypothetical protein JWQ16_2541 [Novosphingobium sp.]|nr:hypothetical protein [Novosphingobium sp.]
MRRGPRAQRSPDAQRIISIREVVKLMEAIRRHPDFSFDDPDTIHLGAACTLAAFIVAQGKRLNSKDRHDIAAAGAIMLRHLSDSSGFETLIGFAVAREADKVKLS